MKVKIKIVPVASTSHTIGLLKRALIHTAQNEKHKDKGTEKKRFELTI
jgi:hypothetical protein